MDVDVLFWGADALHRPLLPALQAAHMPGKGASTLQQVQKLSIYRGQEDGENNSYPYKGYIIHHYKRSHMPRYKARSRQKLPVKPLNILTLSTKVVVIT